MSLFHKRTAAFCALIGAAAERREAMETAVAEELGRCERTLSSVRELYKAGHLSLRKNGIRDADGREPDLSALSSLPITALDAAVVLLTTEQAYSGCLHLDDMPTLAEVPHETDAFPRGENERVCDVGVALTSRSDVPLLIAFRADDTMVLRVLEEDRFVAFLTQKEDYLLCLDELPPAAEIRCPTGSTGSAAVLRLPKLGEETDKQ